MHFNIDILITIS